jgi:DNA-binding MarR family transcriptional regulator
MVTEKGADGRAGAMAIATALAEDLERIAVGTVGLTTRVLTEAAPPYDLTFPQWRTLLVVGGAQDGERIGTVASRVGATLPATGRLLRRLERRGLLALAVDERDRRATRAMLTDEGHRVRTTILAQRQATLREIAAALPPSAQADLATGLRAIATALDRYA